MKYIWEECDIRVGRRIGYHNGTEEYIIGYDKEIHTDPKILLFV